MSTTVTPVKLSAEEKSKRFAQLRERQQSSRLKVVAPPGIHPYWADKDDENERSRLEYLGFWIVKEKDRKNPEYKANGLREDGTYVMGDVILMAIEQEVWEFFQAENRQKGKDQREGAIQNFKDEAGKAGVPTFEVKDKDEKN